MLLYKNVQLYTIKAQLLSQNISSICVSMQTWTWQCADSIIRCDTGFLHLVDAVVAILLLLLQLLLLLAMVLLLVCSCFCCCC